ncbi:hypothetical protein [Actinacidiphila bryophytorum]|uniref:hypothetical protein n=1 Tax=Actinacidiphila bryophytorum TaxID=1436133 RepID=UPI002176BB69|nr:hypothetical protein [Actinacidiphila bryophytorum]UWE12910.1 hypothetical protein NYE86_32335 [Actinacidiphila bryophytorum]
MPRLAACFAASLTTAAVLAVPAVLAPATASAAVVHQRVTAADLGPQGPWLRLQDDPSNAGRPNGVQEVAPFADPVRFNGSLHLSVAGAAQAQQAQAAHYFNRVAGFAAIGANPLSYDMYVRGWTSTPSAVTFGANLQLPGFCQGAFTTLSFQPQLATDAQGRTGAVADTWRHFDAGGAALWRTSRAVGTFAAGSDHPFSDYAAACNAAGDGAIGVIANVGRLGDAAASLDTYVDNLTVNGTVYDFAVARTATGRVDLTPTVPGDPGNPGGPGTWSADGSSSAAPSAQAAQASPADGVAPAALKGGNGGGSGGGNGGGGGAACSAEGTVTFTSPADGPFYSSVGTRLTLSRKGGLAPDDVTLTANGEPVSLAEGPGGTLVATVTPPTVVDLGPGGTYRTTIALTCNQPAAGPVSVAAELLAQGYEPLQPTGVVATAGRR